jgi:primase-polymerase (primpol)-like protein
MKAAKKPSLDTRTVLMDRIAAEFPAALQQRKQWVLWRLVPREGNGKDTKVPYQPSGKSADSTNPSTWSDFPTVQAAFIRDTSFSGIGFVFADDDPFIGIDLDKCRDPATGDVEPWAAAVLPRFSTYAELSPSGSGFHIIGQGKLPKKGRRKDLIEMYESGRYFTVTGERWQKKPSEAANIQVSLDAFHAEVFGQPKASPSKKSKRAANDPSMAPALPAKAPPLADAEVLAAMLASRDAAGCKQLQEGNWSALGYPSQSEADLAWAGMLARHTGAQPEQIDRMFRASGMMRDKWDEQRGAQTYGELTIAKVLEGIDSADPESELVDRMNQRFAIVSVGNQIKILDDEDREDIKLLSRPDFAIQTANITSPAERTSASMLWLKSQQRRQFKGLVFSPGRDKPDYYNLWRGFSVEPKKGNCSRFWELVQHAICAGVPELFEYVRRYCAHLVQRPWERPEVALILRGGQGTGKNTFVDTLGSLVSHHFRQVNSTEQLTGRFNGHMKSILLLHANEASWGGNKSERGKLKAMVTDAMLPVEMKNQDIIDIDNYLRLIVSSNEDWPVPIDLDDRRFVVLDVSPAYQQNKTFFAALHAQLDDGGYAALMHDLLAIDLSGFTPRVKPASPFGADIKMRSADGPTRWLYDVLNANTWAGQGFMFEPVGSTAVKQKDEVFKDYLWWAQFAPERHPVDRGQFFKTVLVLLGPAITEVRPAAREGEPRERKLVFSSLAACRSEFERATKTTGTLPWEAP